MKISLIVSLSCLVSVLSGCSALAWKDPNSASQMALIKNYQRCSSDASCPEGQFCSFVGIDTFAVCKEGLSGSSPFVFGNPARW